MVAFFTDLIIKFAFAFLTIVLVMRGFGLILLLGALLSAGLAIQCKLCWPPLHEDDCEENEANIDCRDWKDIGYDSCIEVLFHGNKSIARTCYPSYKCDGAREWCRRYGPCTVNCCKYNLCNDGQDRSDQPSAGSSNSISLLLTSLLSSSITLYLF